MLKKSTIITLSAIIVASFVALTYQSVNGTFQRVNPSQLIFPLFFLKSSVNEYLNLKDENRELRKRIYELMLEKKSNQELLDENRRLKLLLGLKDTRRDIVAYARIVAKGSNRFYRTVWIDKGSNDGVAEGMAVIGIDGLLGKVLSTTGGYSEVLLINDPNFSVSSRVERTRVEGIVSGRGDRCVLKYIPLEEEVMVGDRLVTSGLDGIFPEGIPIGAVSFVSKKEGLFQKIEVIPFQSTNKAEEVAVIKRVP